MIRNLLLKWLGCADYDEIKQQNKHLYQLSRYDDLTGLANRLLFAEQAEKLLARSVYENEPMTVFLIDLDNFKMINDTHGHLVGNKVLKKIAKRIKVIGDNRCTLADSLGKYEKGHECHCVAARLGGDEFVLLFEHMDKHEADIVGQQLTQELKEIVTIKGTEISVSASIGISIYPWDGDNIHTLLKAADLAMYSAKENGKNRHVFHEAWMNTKIERRVEAELVVRDIISSDDVTVYYQPIIDIQTGKIVGAEALLRGKKATDTFFDPTELIAAAEDTNLIVPLGTIILKSACQFARRCLDIIGNTCEASVSVNISAFQLNDPYFIDLIADTLEEANLDPHHLILEITETMLMQDFEHSAKMLGKLRATGVRISIDDFGKGYSSFNYLQRLPISKIKIDMSFIQSIGGDKKANEIVKGIILMAGALGMDTCAEGVETETQYEKLKEYGCDQVQGYLKYKALSESDFVDVLRGKLV